MCLLSFSVSAQIQQAWVARYNNSILNGTNQAVKMVLDSAGNIYVTGFSQNSNTNLGYVTIKYAPNGNQLWSTRYDSTNYPAATPTGLVLDSSNNALVTGNALTVKYDTNGNQLWTAPFPGSALAADTNGNVAVTGFEGNFNTVKLSPSGSNLWVNFFPGACAPAVGQVIVADPRGNFYVAGSYPFFCESEYGNNYVYGIYLLTIKYSANGDQLWTANYNPSGSAGSVYVGGAALDSADNLYLLVSFADLFMGYGTFKYSTGGSLMWTANPDDDLISRGTGLVLDTGTNVLVTGIAADYAPVFLYGTFKLNQNGFPVWTNFYPQPPTGVSGANSITVDSANNSYVTGYSSGTNSNNDIVTIRYSPTGNQTWLQRYSSPGNGNAAGNAIVVDNNGNVYVTGYDTTTAGGTEIVTIKYSPVVTLQRRSDGTVILQAQGTPGESFDIEASEDLLNWLDLGSAAADTNGLMQFDDTNAPAYPARFYYTTPQ
jgi:hypothetical protein